MAFHVAADIVISIWAKKYGKEGKYYKKILKLYCLIEK